MSEIHIREERSGDEAAIAAVLKSAFGQEDESRLVTRLRMSEELVISLVAGIDGHIAGHIGFTQGQVRSDHSEMAVAWLVPLSVAPDYQRRGIGEILVRTGLEACRERGYSHVVVVGDPAYYRRFGFTRKAAHGIESRWSESLLAMALTDSLDSLRGDLIEPTSFAALE